MIPKSVFRASKKDMEVDLIKVYTELAEAEGNEYRELLDAYESEIFAAFRRAITAESKIVEGMERSP